MPTSISTADSQQACFRNAEAVTPSNSNNLPNYAFKGLWISTDGTIAVDLFGTGTNISFTVVAGTHFPGVVTKVYSTGTTATVVALW